MYNPGNDTSWRAAGSADFSGSLFRSGSYAVCRSLFAVRTRLSLKINGISSRLITLKTKIGAYMTLGAVGTTGMFQSAEALQAAGLATAVVSLWFLFKECLTSFRRKREEGGAASEESEKELSEKALVLRRQGEHHYDMGRKFQNGIGINSDYSRAFQHFYEGAKLGNRECAAELGTFYEYGKGVPRNEFLAQYWYEEGAYGGSGMACYYLARWYLAQERKTPEIRRRAVYFLDEACFNGNVKAQELRGILIQKNTFTDSATEEQLGSATRDSMTMPFTRGSEDIFSGAVPASRRKSGRPTGFWAFPEGMTVHFWICLPGGSGVPIMTESENTIPTLPVPVRTETGRSSRF